jgi:uncharacterized membrane protein YphA (DoxX/SURF4 family)
LHSTRRIPLATSPRNQLSTLAIVAVVALRMGIGFHFFCEGVSKLQNPKPFSAGFLSAAKGPFAGAFQGMVWDKDGLGRLDVKGTKRHFANYRQRAKNHFGFDKAQAQLAEKLELVHGIAVQTWIDQNHDDIFKYKKGIERLKDIHADPSRMEVASLKGQAKEIAGEQKILWMPIQAKIDSIWIDYERAVNTLATSEQYNRGGYIEIGKLDAGVMQSGTIDGLIPWFDLTIGLLLLFGLFTRPAALAAAAFLASVVLTQWPLADGALPVYNQFVEMIALLVVAAIGAGRFAGLDLLVGFALSKCCKPKQKTEQAK